MSAAGAKAQEHRLQVVSHNLANVDTPGFKPQVSVPQARFAELIERGEAGPGTGKIDDVGGGVTMQPTSTEFKTGPLRTTGNETDFAISDPNVFFVVARDGEQHLTRAGNFSFNPAGTMVTPSGDPVLSADGRPIQIQPDLPFHVLDGGFIQQGDQRTGLMLARPQQVGDLSRVGENLFRPLAEIDLEAADNRPVTSGVLEQSAVNPTGTMMDLIEASRMYEANVRMIQNQDHVLGTLIGRVLTQ